MSRPEWQGAGTFLSPQGGGRWVPNGYAVTHSHCPRGYNAEPNRVGTQNAPTLHNCRTNKTGWKQTEKAANIRFGDPPLTRLPDRQRL